MRNLVGIVRHTAHVSQLLYVLVAHVRLDYCIQPCFVQVLVIGFASLFRLILDDVLFFVVVAHLVVMVATFISSKLRPPSNSAGVYASVLFIDFFHLQSVLIIFYNLMILLYKGRERDVLRIASLRSGLVTCEAKSACLTPCRA